MVRENRPLKCGLIFMGDIWFLGLILLTLTWLSISSVSFFAGTNMRTICVVTVRINIANMVAIATLIDICKQKWIAKTLLDREKNIKFQFFIICREIYSFIYQIKCNDYTLAWLPVSSVSFLTGADIRVVSVSTVRIYVTYIVSSTALVDAWGHK